MLGIAIICVVFLICMYMPMKEHNGKLKHFVVSVKLCHENLTEHDVHFDLSSKTTYDVMAVDRFDAISKLAKTTALFPHVYIHCVEEIK